MPIKDKEKRREYQKKYNSTWYKKLSPDRKKLRSSYIYKEQRARAKNYRKDFIKHLGSKCNDCLLEYHQSVMDFHHLKDKKDTICRMIGCGLSYNKILKEVNKCILLCANCHRLRHFNKPMKQK